MPCGDLGGLATEWVWEGPEPFCGDAGGGAGDIGKESGGRSFWIYLENIQRMALLEWWDIPFRYR